MATRSSRPTQEQLNKALQDIQNELKFHVGKKAILYVKQGRDTLPYFIDVCERPKGMFFGRYRCWDPENRFRCYLTISISPIDILTAHQKIVYFDEGI